MFVQWDGLMDVITRFSVNNGFLETFKHTANNEKVNLCVQSDFIRYIFISLIFFFYILVEYATYHSI